LFHILFNTSIVLGGFLVLSPFLAPIIWAAIFAVASWSIYQKTAVRLFPNSPSVSAGLATISIAVLIVAPLTFFIYSLAYDIQNVILYLNKADHQGLSIPNSIQKILPVLPQELQIIITEYWNKYLGTKGALSELTSHILEPQVVNSLKPLAQSILADVAKRLATLFFTLFIIYFFFRDGLLLRDWITKIGNKVLGMKRFHRYAKDLPAALSTAVYGLVGVWAAEAMLLALLLNMFHIPSAMLLGVLTAIAAFIPLLAPLILILIGTPLILLGHIVAGLTIIILGTILVLGADYAIRPLVLQKTMKLPFMAILLGMFGGVMTMGLLGLILGPVLLVLLLLFLEEAKNNTQPHTPNNAHHSNE
jgi:predicted PurR-regulated permease PerM